MLAESAPHLYAVLFLVDRAGRWRDQKPAVHCQISPCGKQEMHLNPVPANLRSIYRFMLMPATRHATCC